MTTYKRTLLVRWETTVSTSFRWFQTFREAISSASHANVTWISLESERRRTWLAQLGSSHSQLSFTSLQESNKWKLTRGILDFSRYPAQVQYQPRPQYQPEYRPQYRSQYQPQYQGQQQQRSAYPAAPIQNGIQGRPAPADPNAGLASYTVNYKR